MNTAVQPSLPALSALFVGVDGNASSPLATALSVLFEPSPVLFTHLVPTLFSTYADPSTRPTPIASYADVIDAALAIVFSWPDALRSAFVVAHPRIGETKGLSSLSATEQASRATPAEVLQRLEYLNALYETRYPGLRYITFVNGRSRTEIALEMESFLGLDNTEVVHAQPKLEVPQESDAWRAELERAIESVGKIAKSRLATLHTT